MARKTKEATERTRLEIIAAARKAFAERGVSRTSLEHIAREAGVTRGAIYWHFENKPDLFFAMLDQVSLPMIDLIDESLPEPNPGDPLRSIQASMLSILRLFREDAAARTTHEIVTLKCEYVAEFARLERKVNKAGCAYVQKLTTAYADAADKGLLRPGADPALYALDSFLFLKGLVHIWLADDDGSLIRDKAADLIESHIRARYRTG